MYKKIYIFILVPFFLVSCQESKKENLSLLVEEWIGKEIVYPDNLSFTLWGKDTIDNIVTGTPYTIVTYADSVGCISCKLHLTDWMSYIMELEKTASDRVKVLFLFHPKESQDIVRLLKRERFSYPVCIDVNDSFNKSNKFPSDMAFQTFLLDRGNRVIAIGNPIYNPKIKELYMDIIQGGEPVRKEPSLVRTEVSVNARGVSLGTFSWTEEQTVTFILKNTGDNPLVIEEVTTSCGCILAEYPKEPVHPGMSVSLDITYKANHSEYFSKTVSVYCNAETSPLKLVISGNAE